MLKVVGGAVLTCTVIAFAILCAYVKTKDAEKGTKSSTD